MNVSLSDWPVFVILLRREISRFWAGGSGVILPIGFLLIAISLAPFVFDLTTSSANDQTGDPAIGLVWFLIALIVLWMQERLFQADVEDGTLRLHLTAPFPLETFVLAKVLAASLVLLAALLGIGPVMILLLGWSIAHGLSVFLALVPGIVGLFAFGALGGALTAGHRRLAFLVAILVLPFFVPLLIFGSAASFVLDHVAVALNVRAGGPGNGDAKAAFFYLSGFSLLGLGLMPIASAAILRTHSAN